MQDKFCPMPFGSMHIDPNGDILVCCSDSGKMLDSQGKRYNVQTHTLKEAWNSDYYQTLRTKFLRGEQPETCKSCWQLEAGDNSVSTRIYSINRFTSFQQQGLDLDRRLSQARDNQGVLQDPPVDFQVMSGNLCNLACKMCFPRYSNTWSKFYTNKNKTVAEARLHSKMANPVDVYTDFGSNYDWPRTVTMNKIFKELIDNVYHINLTGGEPTLLEENIEFLENLKSSKNLANLEVQIITNTTNINKRLLDCIREFPRVNLLSSIDGMDEIAYIQRTPSNWQQIYKNYCTIQKFLVDNPHIKYGIITTVTALNIHHISKLWDFFVDKAEYKISPGIINMNIVISKSQSTGLELVPQSTISKIKQDFENTSSIKNTKVYKSMMNYFDNIEWASDNIGMLELLDSVQQLHPDFNIKDIYAIHYQ